MKDPAMNNESPQRKRRARYKGTHPVRFDEKYKELNPEKYPDAVEKVIKSGRTPAGMHRPILVKEVLDILAPEPGEIGLDATLGFGGHAQELLKRVAPRGRLFGIDVDPAELSRAAARLPKLLDLAGGGFDFILADLGVSSMQLDNPARGFTFKTEGPLDLRYNPDRGQPASAFIKAVSEAVLEKILRVNSDEPHAEAIAKAVHERRSEISTTTALADAVRDALAAVAPANPE
jgi:16S rRNA (cytosine1402-N4)-methyltransferase